ncbi:fasciclin-like arabinogalactan protein 21 [Rhododendron vialii]|uniref:fasciclin-like arabinogalactan protein 21 n=1 Tax=Rhododendron vialii TaxID=182163 RepID=UPI00265EBC12|nr:fasciclin-like arabinogalactan protein 21 [Rhododendron vialii]
MAIFHLHHYQGRGLYFFKLLAISLPLFCLLAWASSTPTTTPSQPPTTPPPSASQSLKTSGYSVFAALITATANTSSWNGTGTVLAPPDFAFSSAAAKLNDNRRRPSASLLLHHTLQEPLTWHALSAHATGHQLPTWRPNRCVFLSKGSNANLGISISPRQHSSPIAAVKIKRPDLYVDDHLTVHGVDDVLDPTSLSACSFPDPTARVESQIDRSFLDHAVRALKRRGFGVVATAMAIRRSILLRQKEITVFAPSDASLFSYSDGFRFDFLRHVVPERRRFADIASVEGTAIETLSPNKSVVFRSRNGYVTVNGVAIRSLEVYRNRWIVVFPVSRSVDDEEDDVSDTGRDVADSGVGDEISGRSHSPAAEEEEGTSGWRFSREVSPATWNGGVSTLALAVEGEEGLVCPLASRSLRESRMETGVYVERSSPSISYDEFSVKLVESGPSHGFNRGL